MNEISKMLEYQSTVLLIGKKSADVAYTVYKEYKSTIKDSNCKYITLCADDTVFSNYSKISKIKEEILNRELLFHDLKIGNIDKYNKLAEKHQQLNELKHIVINVSNYKQLISNMQDSNKACIKEFKDALNTIYALGRSDGVRLIISSDVKPSKDDLGSALAMLDMITLD
jgi:hypothetical protein